jgi:hypothetical protein
MNHPSGMQGPVTAIQTCYRLAENPEDALPAVQTATAGEAGHDAREIWCGKPTGEGCSAVGAVVAVRKERRCQRRAKRNKLLEQANGGIRKTEVKTVVQKWVGEAASGSLTSTNLARSALKAAEGGWLGSRAATPLVGEFTIGELLLSGLQLVEWDGM